MRDQLKWKKDKLYFGEEFIAEITPDKELEGLWRVKWPDGALSENFYNKTRAMENAMKIAIYLKTGKNEEVLLEYDAP